MRDVVVYSYCDRCWHELDEQRTLATAQFTIGINEGDKSHPPVKLIEVCETHAVELKQLLALVGEVAEMPTPTSKQPQKAQPVVAALRAPDASGDLLCPICHLAVRRYNLPGHVWQVHVPGRRQENVIQCPDCSFISENATGLSAHRRGAHDYDALAVALSNVPGYKPAAKSKSTKSAAKEIESSK